MVAKVFPASPTEIITLVITRGSREGDQPNAPHRSLLHLPWSGFTLSEVSHKPRMRSQRVAAWVSGGRVTWQESHGVFHFRLFCAHIKIPTRKECDVPLLPTNFEGIEVRAYLILLSLALFSPLWHRKTFLLHVAKTITSSTVCRMSRTDVAKRHLFTSCLGTNAYVE